MDENSSNMPVDIVPANDNNSTTEEEIIEDISIAGDFTDSDDEIPLFLNLSDCQKFSDQQHQNIHEEEDDEELLKNIDDALSFSNIAKHFKPVKGKPSFSDEKENILPCSEKSSSYSKPSKTDFGEDTILLNDRKVNLSDLTKCQEESSDNCKTKNKNKLKTFFSLDLPDSEMNDKPAPPKISQSLDLDLSFESLSSSNVDQQENQIDEIEDTKQFISRPDDQITITKMNRVSLDYLKDPLDDITEEESDMEQKEQQENTVGNQTSRESDIEILHKPDDRFNQFYESDTIPIRNQFLSLESQISKDLQTCGSSKEISVENSQILDALNLKLSSLVKRSHDPSLKNSNSKDCMSFTTTTSTEYRTIDEELNMKIFDIDNELQDRATCIEKLKEKLQQSMIDRDQILSENQTLSEEILKLQTKVAEFGMLSRKSSDDNKLTVIANKNIDALSKSFSKDELACFEKIKKKIEIYHENEIEKVRDQNLKELKNIMEGSREVFEHNFEGTDEYAVSSEIYYATI